MGNSILIWLLAIPLATSLLAFGATVTGATRRKVAETIHLIGIFLLLLGTLALVARVMAGGSLSALTDWLYADKLTALFILVIGVMGFLNGLYAIGYLRHDLENNSTNDDGLCKFYGFYHLFLFTMLLAVLPNNIVVMWIGIEATTLGSAFLVGFYRHRLALEASWKYVLICSIGVGLALFGTLLFYSGAFNVSHNAHSAMLWTEIYRVAHQLDPRLTKLSFLFIFLGYGTKAGLFPMHAWLPDAHSEAPSPVSSLLSGVLLNCALFAIIRYYMVVANNFGPSFPRILFLAFGIVSVACASFFIFIQRDLKRMLAYSSIENIGLITTALGIGGPLGILAALLQIVNHSVAKSFLFCSAGNIMIKYNSRDLRVIKGLLKTAPITALLFGCGALAISGTPPFNIFISELMIVLAGLKSGYLWLMVAILLLLVIVFAAFLKVIGSSLFGAPPENVNKGEVNWITTAPICLMLVLLLGLGIYLPAPFYQLLHGAAATVTSALNIQ